MSHFYGVVCLRPGDDGKVDLKQEAVEEAISLLMHPYSENTEVDEYERDCWCIGEQARADASKYAVEKVCSIDKIREKFWKKFPKGFEDPNIDLDAEWKKTIQPYSDAEKEAFNNHPGKEDPAADCDNCNGTGKYKTTANPDGYWDWYVIGGRWDGCLTSVEPIEDGQGGFNYGDKFHTVGRNALSAHQMQLQISAGVKDILPYALIDGAGFWHQHGKMGWFGCSSEEMSEADWMKKVIETLKAEPEGTICIGIDCHT